MVGTTRDRLEVGAGTGRKGGGISRTGGSNCREGDDEYTRIGKGNGGGGVTGGPVAPVGMNGAGRRIKTAQSKTGDIRVEIT